jgi:hypothetical protein
MAKQNPDITKTDAARSWHRQPKETPRQYEIFEYFLSLPPAERIANKVSSRFKVSDSYINKMRRVQKWNDRARDRDNHLASKADEAAERVVEQVAFDWQSYEQENLQNSVELSRLFAGKAKEIALMPVTETTETITEQTPDGKTIHKTIVHRPLRVTASDAPRFAEAALILSRYAIEQSEAARRGESVNIHLPKPPKPLDQMTPDERGEYIKQLSDAREALIRGDGVETISDAAQ